MPSVYTAEKRSSLRPFLAISPIVKQVISSMPKPTESNIVAINASNASSKSSSNDAAVRHSRPVSYQAKIHRDMSAPLIHLQEKSQQLLMKSLQDMFDKIDDALFELAERSVNNSEQNIFFESMREVRLKRIDIEAQYANSFGEGFVALFQTAASDVKPSLVSSADIGLSLMGDEAVEEMVAMDAMVAKAEKHLSRPLTALYARKARSRLSDTVFRLPMSRADMGNYLGLTVETISRVFNRLQKQQVLLVNNKEITVLDKEALCIAAGLKVAVA